jgi:hypothetical protein
MPLKNVQSLQNIEHRDKFIMQTQKHTCATFIYIKALSFSFSNLRFFVHMLTILDVNKFGDFGGGR